MYLGVGRKRMSNYTPEYEIDDFIDGCECCAMNLEILEGKENE